MRVIAFKILRAFFEKNKAAETPLRAWFKIIQKNKFRNLAEIKATFPSADLVGKFIVFSIGGNKYRLITVIHFNTGRVYIRDILTHKDYDKGDWKND